NITQQRAEHFWKLKMRTFIAFISVIFCLLKLTNAQVTNCTGSEDRLIEFGCRAFTGCRNETFVNVECEPGYVVDVERLLCDLPENVPAPCGGNRNCTGLPDGTYPDYFNNCTSYYTCQGGESRGTTICPGDLVFDDFRNICDRVENVCEPCGTLSPENCIPTPPFTGSTVTTDEVSTEPPIIRNCTGRPDGYYPDLEEGCRTLYTCRDQVMSGYYECPDGLVFDPEDNICDWPYGTCPPCGDGSRKNPGYCKNCTGLPNGKYPDLDGSCSGSFTCGFGVMTKRTICPQGEVYDPERGACTAEVEDVCPPCYNGSGSPPARCPTEAPAVQEPGV
ncbi:unnamed protein product, partial [Owenia fusiformis]